MHIDWKGKISIGLKHKPVRSCESFSRLKRPTYPGGAEVPNNHVRIGRLLEDWQQGWGGLGQYDKSFPICHTHTHYSIDEMGMGFEELRNPCAEVALQLDQAAKAISNTLNEFDRAMKGVANLAMKAIMDLKT